MTEPIALFVYGSLLAGGENHHVLRGARLLRAARTAPRYTLVDLGPYPALVEEGATEVKGELYEVEAPLLAELDVFEGCPDLYYRALVRLARGVTAHAYLMRAERARSGRIVSSGDYRVYARALATGSVAPRRSR